MNNSTHRHSASISVALARLVPVLPTETRAHGSSDGCAPKPRTIHFISSPKRILCYSTHAQLRSMTYVFASVLPPRTSTDFWVRTLIRNRINETFCVRTTVSFSRGRGSFRSTHTFLLGRTVIKRQHHEALHCCLCCHCWLCCRLFFVSLYKNI